MDQDLVIGIDSSTTATKAIAWNARGEAVAEGRCSIALRTPAPFCYEQDSHDWWRTTASALRILVGQFEPRRVAALAIANQRETVALVDEAGDELHPAMVWLDERSRGVIDGFADGLGRTESGLDRIHQITGKPRDVTPVVYRLAWLRQHDPEVLRAPHIVDVQGYLVHALTGHWRTTWPSADPFGVFDMSAQRWSAAILDALGLTAGQFSETLAPATRLGEVTAAAAAATGLAAGTPVFGGGGDGQLAGLGVNALNPERAYLNLGTAVVSGVYSPVYRADLAWRSMGSATGVGCYLETCLRSGTFLINWFAEQLCQFDPGRDADVFRRLEAAAAAVPAGARGLLLVPYWSGVMTPYWQPLARGAVIGLAGNHDQAHLYRALLEGVALEQAMMTARVEEVTGQPVVDYVAIGGGASSDLWCQIFADATGKRVRRSATVEASSLGAGMCAAVGAGWYPDFAAAAAGMSGRLISDFSPRSPAAERYAELLPLYREIHPRLADLYGCLARYAED